MAVYLQATLQLDYRTLPIFLNIAPAMKEIVEQVGWEMISALVSKIGPMNTVIHLWRLPDMNTFDTGIQAIAASSEAGRIYKEICDSGAKEMLIFADEAPYSPTITVGNRTV
jgi:hypothetical protein